MKPIITVNPRIDKEIDKYFSKKKVKTHKLVRLEALYTKIIAEAQFAHEQFMPRKAKSYKAGFDNGYYVGLAKAAKICLNYKFKSRKPRIKDEDRRVLTGKELRVAGEKHLPVYYIEVYSGYDSHMDYRGKCYMEPANTGYYIGNSDIDPGIYEDNDEVSGTDMDNTSFKVCAIGGVVYA